MMAAKKPRPGFKIVSTKYRGDYEIPESWDFPKLGKNLKLAYGKGLIEDNRSNEGFPVYGSGGIIGKHSEYLCKGSGIIVSRKGSLGNTYYEKNNFWPIDTVYYITKKETKNNLEFTYYLLQFLKLENYAIVTAQPGISRDEIYTILVRLPPIPQQEKIGEILENIDVYLNQLEKSIQHYRLLKQGLMQKLLIRGINHFDFKTVKWWFGKTLEIPQDWSYSELENFVGLPAGDYFPLDDFEDNGIPVLKIDNIMYGKTDWENCTYLSEKYSKDGNFIFLQKDDIVLALNRPITNNKIKVAKLTNEDVPSILYQRVGKFEFLDNTKLNREFFYHFLNGFFFKQLITRIQIGSDQPYIKTTELLKQKIPIPKKIIEQEKIAEILTNMDNQIINLEFKKNRFKEIKKSLMQKLLTGEIRVKV